MNGVTGKRIWWHNDINLFPWKRQKNHYSGYFLHALEWRHNEHDCVSNHQPHDCLLSRLFRRRSKQTSKLRDTGLCAWNSPVTGEIPAKKGQLRGKYFHLMTSSWSFLSLPQPSRWQGEHTFSFTRVIVARNIYLKQPFWMFFLHTKLLLRRTNDFVWKTSSGTPWGCLPTWISKYMPRKVWDEITHQFRSLGMEK